jgi:hypothetical protein
LTHALVNVVDDRPDLAGQRSQRGPLTLPWGELEWDPRLMKKLLVALAVLAGIAFLARRLAPDLSKIDWEKKFEAMPDNAPPKWMFTNISAIRDNTERIIELLESNSEPRGERPGIEGSAS